MQGGSQRAARHYGDQFQHRQNQGCETFTITSQNEMLGFKECQKILFGLAKWKNNCVSSRGFQKICSFGKVGIN